MRCSTAVNRLTNIVFAAISLVILQSCMWEKRGEFSSPDRRRSISVYAPYPTNGALTVNVLQDGHRIYEWHKTGGDLLVNFMHAQWTPDSSVVGAFYNGTAPVEFAFDYRRKTPVPFTVIKDLMARAIRRQYNLSQSDNPFACQTCVVHFQLEHPDRVSH